MLDKTLSEDFVSVSQPIYSENGALVLMSEDDSQEFPRIVTYDINEFLACPRNTLTGDDG